MSARNSIDMKQGDSKPVGQQVCEQDVVLLTLSTPRTKVLTASAVAAIAGFAARTGQNVIQHSSSPCPEAEVQDEFQSCQGIGPA